MAAKARRAAIMCLHQEGKRLSEIARLLNLDPSNVRRTVNSYQNVDSLEDRPRSGRPRSARTTGNVRKIRDRLKGKKRWSSRKLAADIGISATTVRRSLKEDLHLTYWKPREAHLLTDEMKAIRMTRSRKLLRRFGAGRHRNIIFSDEKMFSTEQSFNPRNDGIWAAKSPGQLRIVERKQKPKSVMVWAAITSIGKSPLVFIDQGVKMNQEIYQKKILESTLLPWATELFPEQKWTFQQDSAPSHAATDTQQWIRSHTPDFISKEEWPPYSPDLNPLDFSVWGILESKACMKPHQSLASLKRSLKKAWADLPLTTVAKITDQFPKRLRSCIDASGGHFES